MGLIFGQNLIQKVSADANWLSVESFLKFNYKVSSIHSLHQELGKYLLSKWFLQFTIPIHSLS